MTTSATILSANAPLTEACYCYKCSQHKPKASGGAVSDAKGRPRFCCGGCLARLTTAKAIGNAKASSRLTTIP